MFQAFLHFRLNPGQVLQEIFVFLTTFLIGFRLYSYGQLNRPDRNVVNFLKQYLHCVVPDLYENIQIQIVQSVYTIRERLLVSSL